MSLTTIGIVGIILLVILLFCDMPVGFVMSFLGFWGFCYVRGQALGGHDGKNFPSPHLTENLFTFGVIKRPIGLAPGRENFAISLYFIAIGMTGFGNGHISVSDGF